VLARALALVVIAAAAAAGGGTARAQGVPAPVGPAPAPIGPAPAPIGPAPAPPAPAAAPTAPAPAVTVPENPRFPDVIQPPPGFDRDPAWAEYDGAFRDAAAGDVKAARARLTDLTARWPGHPAQRRAAALLERLRAREAASNVARGELVFWSTLGGVSLAANLCVAIDCSTAREYAGVYTLSIGGALAASLLASQRGIHQGEAQLYNSAQTWGAWNALLINDGFPDTSAQASIAIAAQLGGLAAGVGLWQTWRPTQGDVALTNTFLLWGSVMTVWGHVIASTTPDLQTVIAVGDASLLIGALVSTQVKMSRGRTLLIDIGGVLGAMTGGLVALGADSDTAVGVLLMGGTAAGLGIAVAGTLNWDKAPPVQVAPAVLDGPSRSKGYGVAAGFSF
jgi:hypothetical protein